MGNRRKLDRDDLGCRAGNSGLNLEKEEGAIEQPEVNPENELDALKDLIRKSNHPEKRRLLLEQIQIRFGNRAAADTVEELKMSEEPEEEKDAVVKPSGVKKTEDE